MADTQLTLFDLPNSPDEFGVSLVSPALRRLEFSSLDYPTIQRTIIEYIRTYFPDIFNDFATSNGIIMLAEIVASTAAKLSLRGDLLFREGFLPTAQTEEAVINHLALIDQKLKRQTPAVVDVQVTLTNPATTDVEIDPGVTFSVTGPDKTRVYYELYRAPGDFSSKILIQSGKRGVIAWGIEGQFVGPVVTTSAGGIGQTFTISAPNVLEEPIYVSVSTGTTSEDWTVVTDPLERYGSNDKVVQAKFYNDRVDFKFGDDVNGQAPLSGQTVSFTYRVGGGTRGRIGINAINESRPISPAPPANAPVEVRFRNLSSSVGGTDAETLEQAKKRAPKESATHGSIVTAEDYAQTGSNFSHPVFGAVSKALATVRTGINSNLVEVYVLAEGATGLPVAPSSGLKIGLKSYYSELNVLTDQVEILDGAIKGINIDMTVVISRGADASVVKSKVEAAFDDFFNLRNWDMGQAFYTSDLINAIKSVDGVAYVDLYEPVDNILPTKEIADSTDATGVGFNELIVLSSKSVKYFYDQTRTNR